MLEAAVPLQLISCRFSVGQPLFHRVGSVPPRSNPPLLQFHHAPPSFAPVLLRSTLLYSSFAAFHLSRLQLCDGPATPSPISRRSSHLFFRNPMSIPSSYNCFNLEMNS
ncbi:hypothetical protein HN51_041474, partial [Arachis hypogaea]